MDYCFGSLECLLRMVSTVLDLVVGRWSVFKTTIIVRNCWPAPNNVLDITIRTLNARLAHLFPKPFSGRAYQLDLILVLDVTWSLCPDKDLSSFDLLEIDDFENSGLLV